MPNNFFQFKQFTVQQERAALKVSTDSCLFGAWIANETETKKLDVQTALDIGAGSGLLMLMLAQKCNALIDGIEIDKASFEQAKENITASSWKERMNLLYGDVKQFEFDKKYDLIIANPPFYENELKSNTAERNVAMHDAGLKLDELLKVVDKNLSDDGWFAVLLPYRRTEKFIAETEESNLNLIKRTDVKQTVNHTFFRTMLLFGRKEGEAKYNTMAIKNEHNEYTVAFTELLKDYYLNL